MFFPLPYFLSPVCVGGGRSGGGGGGGGGNGDGDNGCGYDSEVSLFASRGLDGCCRLLLLAVLLGLMDR